MEKIPEQNLQPTPEYWDDIEHEIDEDSDYDFMKELILIDAELPLNASQGCSDV